MRTIHWGQISIISIVMYMILILVPITFADVAPDSDRVMKFWDSSINYVHQYQIASNSCGPACVQMVLGFYDVDPLPSQEELAIEMNTTLCEYTDAKYVPIPFRNHEIDVVFAGHLNNTDSLRQLKGNVSSNRPAILLMWYETNNITGHYRVLTGYNETGFFLHDPAKEGSLYSGPNVYFDNVLFGKLWTRHDNWVIILESGEPHILPSDFNFQPVVVGLILLTLAILAIYIYHKKKKTPVQYILSVLWPVLGIILWMLIDHFYIKNLFTNIGTNEIADLSKTMIQAVGTLISFAIVAAAFHLGKIEELANSYYFRANDLMKNLFSYKEEAENSVRKTKQLKAKYPKICQRCESFGECEIKDSLEKKLSESVESVEERAKFANKIFDEAEDLPDELSNIFDKGQVADTLRLMRKTATTKVNEELGCDICRFSGVRALILPRILSAGEAYELQAILVDPVKRRHVDRIRVTALGREEVLLHAIDKLAIQVRSRLGETLVSIEKADAPVTQVTTSSWEALKYLSMGIAKWHEMKFPEAAPLFELALEKDPHFVSARGSLGLLLIQFLGEKEKGKEMLRLALEDAEAQALPQIEHLRIKAVNRQFVDEDFAGALEEYRLMREIDPDYMPAYNNAGMILRSLGRYDEAIAMYKKAAEVAPRNSIPLSNLWWTHMYFTHDVHASEEVGRILVNLGPEIASYLNFLAYSLAVQGKFDEALEFLRKTVALEPQHPYGLPNLAHSLLASGRAAEAVPVYREVRELVRQRRIGGTFAKCSFDLALALAETGEKEAAKKIATEGREYLLEELGSASPSAHYLIILGELEAVDGNTTEARQYLSKALNLGVKDPSTLQILSELYTLLGDKTQAIGTLEKALESGFPDYFFPLIMPAYQSIRNDPQFRALFSLDR